MNSEDLTGFIAQIAYIDSEEIDGDMPLFSSGIIDSVSLLELVSYVEQNVGFKVSATQITLAHWDSVNKILDFVATATA